MLIKSNAFRVFPFGLGVKMIIPSNNFFIKLGKKKKSDAWTSPIQRLIDIVTLLSKIVIR
jgi:hypothetical protein